MLEAQAGKLHKQLQGLAEELEISKLEPDEMQKRMLAKVTAREACSLYDFGYPSLPFNDAQVKSDNAQSQAADERIKHLKDEIRRAEQVRAIPRSQTVEGESDVHRCRQSSAELAADIAERNSGGNGDKDKVHHDCRPPRCRHVSPSLFAVRKAVRP
jgi:hypothetical protein